MSWMLLRVYHEIVENADFGAVLASDTIIRFLKKVIQRLKQVVPVRPIRHWNDRRVAAHIFLSILACLVLAVLRYLARQTEAAWVAVRLEAEKDVQVALALT